MWPAQRNAIMAKIGRAGGSVHAAAPSDAMLRQMTALPLALATGTLSILRINMAKQYSMGHPGT
jgi:hypothetical protein